MTYKQIHDWQVLEEEKGWDKPNMSDELHRVKIREKETGDKNEQWFHFTPNQTSSERWKKHVDQWIKRLEDNPKPSLT